MHSISSNSCAWLLCAFVVGGIVGKLIAMLSVWFPAKLADDWISESKYVLDSDPIPPVVIGNAQKIGIVILAAVFTAGALFTFGADAKGGFAAVFALTLLALSVIDAHTKLLPDDLTIPLLWVGLLASIGHLFISPQDALLGAVAGYLSLWAIYWSFKLLTGREGMGYGDFKLFAALGAWLGWEQLPTVAILASVVGLLWAVVSRLTQKSNGNRMPFGPQLAISGLAVFTLQGFGVSLASLLV